MDHTRQPNLSIASLLHKQIIFIFILNPIIDYFLIPTTFFPPPRIIAGGVGDTKK